MKSLLLLLGLLASGRALADSSALIGVWQIAETFYDEESIEIRTPPQTKIFTSSHMIYTYYSSDQGSGGPSLGVGHGTYQLEGDTLTETIANHSNADMIGKTFQVNVTVSDDGDSFSQVVDLGKYVLREVWVRTE